MISPTADPALECFTLPEIAKMLHISARHAYRLAECGELPGAFRLGKLVRVNKGAFLAWQARLAAEAEAQVTSGPPKKTNSRASDGV